MTTSVLATDAKPVVEVNRVTDADADAVAEFMCRVWGGPVTGERVRRSLRESARTNPAVAGAPVPSVVYRRNGEALGYLGSIPVRLWNGAVEASAHWLKGFMVLPDHQNGPIGFALLREMLRQVDLAGTMTVAQPARRLFQAVGFVDCGALPNYVAPLRAGRIAARVDLDTVGIALPPFLQRVATAAQKSGLAFALGGLIGIGISVWNSVSTWRRALVVDRSASFPSRADLDDLWKRARAGIRSGAARDGSYLTWRYAEQSGGKYEVAAVRDRARRRLEGIAVVRRTAESHDPRLRGLKLATLADILFDTNSPHAGVAAMAAAENLARRMGADALLCTTAHPAITSLLRRRGYVRFAGTIHLMLRDTPGSPKFSHQVEDWWLMRGDANSDDAF